MPKKIPANADSPKPRRQRKRRPAHFIATVYGNDTPVVVVAANHKAALKALVTLADASATDLIAAGKAGYAVVDTAQAVVAKPSAAQADPAADPLGDPS